MTRPRRGPDQEPFLTIKAQADVQYYMSLLRKTAEQAVAWVRAQSGDTLETLYRMKFDQVGWHPIEDRRLNLIEQLNQTPTYAVALSAASFLLKWHPNCGGFRVAPGAHMALPLDIMSIESGLVGAETFAAVHPRNNRKLELDLAKLAPRSEQYRYVFFGSPKFPGLLHRSEFDSAGVQVWSVEI